MNGSLQPRVRASVVAALIAAILPVQAATIRAGSGASPPATATGIYEIAVLKNDAGQLQRILALVHRGMLWEVHSRSSSGYLRRVAGSSPVRVAPGTYTRLVALTGGTNRDVNTLPLAIRCEYYTLARLDRTRMNCPSATGLPEPAREGYGAMVMDAACPPPDHELVITVVYGRETVQCVEKPTTRLPAVPGRFVSSLFGRPIAFVHVAPAVAGTTHGALAFAGFHLAVGWIDDGP